MRFMETKIVHVVAQQIVNSLHPEWRTFEIDFNINNFESLKIKLIKEFNIKNDYMISYMGQYENSSDLTFIPLLSEWDLEDAIVTASNPCLNLKIEIMDKHNRKKHLKEWDVVSSLNINHMQYQGSPNTQSNLMPIHSFDFPNDTILSSQPNPLNDTHFASLYLDNSYRDDHTGKYLHPNKFKMAVYLNGIEKKSRKTLWPFLFSIFPSHYSQSTGPHQPNTLPKKCLHKKHLKKLDSERRRLYLESLSTDYHKLWQLVSDIIRRPVLNRDVGPFVRWLTSRYYTVSRQEMPICRRSLSYRPDTHVKYTIEPLTSPSPGHYYSRVVDIETRFDSNDEGQYTIDYFDGKLDSMINLIRKDVLRTDRRHPFYVFSPDNPVPDLSVNDTTVFSDDSTTTTMTTTTQSSSDREDWEADRVARESHATTNNGDDDLGEISASSRIITGQVELINEFGNYPALCLFNVLVLYAATHPRVSYCQGMSDLASLIVYGLKVVGPGDEPLAYAVFTAYMERALALKKNFDNRGTSVALKLDHLSRLVSAYDPTFHSYLSVRYAEMICTRMPPTCRLSNRSDADGGDESPDLLFAYRWILLNFKREFGSDLEAACRVLETIQATAPSSYDNSHSRMVAQYVEDDGGDKFYYYHDCLPLVSIDDFICVISHQNITKPLVTEGELPYTSTAPHSNDPKTSSLLSLTPIPNSNYVNIRNLRRRKASSESHVTEWENVKGSATKNNLGGDRIRSYGSDFTKSSAWNPRGIDPPPITSEVSRCVTPKDEIPVEGTVPKRWYKSLLKLPFGWKHRKVTQPFDGNGCSESHPMSEIDRGDKISIIHRDVGLDTVLNEIVDRSGNSRPEPRLIEGTKNGTRVSASKRPAAEAVRATSDPNLHLRADIGSRPEMVFQVCPQTNHSPPDDTLPASSKNCGHENRHPPAKTKLSGLSLSTGDLYKPTDQSNAPFDFFSLRPCESEPLVTLNLHKPTPGHPLSPEGESDTCTNDFSASFAIGGSTQTPGFRLSLKFDVSGMGGKGGDLIDSKFSSLGSIASHDIHPPNDFVGSYDRVPNLQNVEGTSYHRDDPRSNNSSPPRPATPKKSQPFYRGNTILVSHRRSRRHFYKYMWCQNRSSPSPSLPASLHEGDKFLCDDMSTPLDTDPPSPPRICLIRSPPHGSRDVSPRRFSWDFDDPEECSPTSGISPIPDSNPNPTLSPDSADECDQLPRQPSLSPPPPSPAYLLPPPELLGDGSPFTLFLCLAHILSHREYVIRHRLDYNEVGMHFDRMAAAAAKRSTKAAAATDGSVAPVQKLLTFARYLFSHYLSHYYD